MGRDYMDIGSAPAEESCAQLGSEDYYEKARPECTRFINLIREKLGEEPEGARLAIKNNPHEFGSYYSVVCHYDDENDEATKYAFRCEAEAPREWGDEPAPGDVPGPVSEGGDPIAAAILNSPGTFLGLPIFEGSTETVKGSGMPHCDFCNSEVKPVVDGRTMMGPWAAMCEEHYKQHGIGLGTGCGQKFVEQLTPPAPPRPMTVGAVLASKTRPTKVCDSCLSAAADEGPDDLETQTLLMQEMGGDIADHDCDGNCRCACGRG